MEITTRLLWTGILTNTCVIDSIRVVLVWVFMNFDWTHYNYVIVQKKIQEI
jgi:hypothetical protein